MMEQMWNEILERFGQTVTLRGEQEVSCRALVQPWLERKTEQEVPGPLGFGRKDLYRYMGPAQHPLGLDTVVVWNGRDYRVRSAHKVGEGVCPYWWAVLFPGDGVVL